MIVFWGNATTGLGGKKGDKKNNPWEKPETKKKKSETGPNFCVQKARNRKAVWLVSV